ncbi:MAG: hypothetical protein M1833_007025 [Piccolia ochrophora]|nr:MAG: hypothetical protein M1833_007025 [Piccolia ochrophora]
MHRYATATTGLLALINILSLAAAAPAVTRDDASLRSPSAPPADSPFQDWPAYGPYDYKCRESGQQLFTKKTFDEIKKRQAPPPADGPPKGSNLQGPEPVGGPRPGSNPPNPEPPGGPPPSSDSPSPEPSPPPPPPCLKVGGFHWDAVPDARRASTEKVNLTGGTQYQVGFTIEGDTHGMGGDGLGVNKLNMWLQLPGGKYTNLFDVKGHSVADVRHKFSFDDNGASSLMAREMRPRRERVVFAAASEAVAFTLEQNTTVHFSVDFRKEIVGGDFYLNQLDNVP